MKQNILLIYLLISILGVLSIMLPVYFLPDLKQYESPLFPVIRTGLEGISMWSFVFLFLSGFVVKFFFKLSGWKIGLLTMALFPIWIISEVIVDSTSHNMFPFEIILYSIYTIPAIVGAYLSLGIQKIYDLFVIAKK